MGAEGIAKYLIGTIAILAGLLLISFNRNISKGATKFYRRFYTAKNLRVMFIFIGIFLIFIGIFILVKA